MKYIIGCVDKYGKLYGYYSENKGWTFVCLNEATHLTMKQARAIKDKLYHLYSNDRDFFLKEIQ
jgi:hypothetical protein